MFDIIEIVKPRSVMLQYDKKQRQRENEEEQAPYLARLHDLGYKFTKFDLDTAHFGLPHSRQHQFIIGIRADISGVFWNPQALAPVTRYVRAALASSIAGSRVLPAKSAAQTKYNDWASQWGNDHSEKMLPSVIREAIKDPVRMEPWIEAGFNPSQIRLNAPRVGDKELEDQKFIPFLTFEVLALAQGFPKEWKFLAESPSGQLKMIKEALPPVMAKVVAMSIRSSLTGEAVDLDRAIVEPVIRTSRVGKGRLRLNGGPGRWHGILPPPRLLAKAERVLAGEDIAKVAASLKERKALKIAVAQVEEEKALLEAEREANMPGRYLPA
ncbi:DNA cytosine methyltransferase [Rhizobium sp. BG4]|uniref:DNA cytosine methyltransferase n=1 Tax=Rhizobium sp. BG4 TaxID=2613770 RepID=UPI00193CEDBC|nr:DNA cytosine methyltransferase [Rhizobium sp. BG4]